VKLYGTITSPYVRRVRVVAAEIGEPIELVDTAPDAGQAQLRAVSPIWKVPVADVGGGRIIYDSRVIVDWMTTTRGWGAMAPPRDRWREANLLSAIEGALDSVISLFYLRRENAPIEGLPYTAKQTARAAAIFDWLATQLVSDGTAFDPGPSPGSNDPMTRGGGGLGLAEVTLVCALDWMDFRAAYPTANHAALGPLRAAWRERPSLAQTRPNA
jgi:glutathione S-transferase